MKLKLALLLLLTISISSCDGKDNTERKIENLGFSVSVPGFKNAIIKGDISAINNFLSLNEFKALKEVDNMPVPVFFLQKGSSGTLKVYLDSLKSKSKGYAFEHIAFMAVELGKPEHALVILSYVNDPELKFDYGTQLIHVSSKKGMNKVVTKLVQDGVNPNITDDLNNLPINFAIDSGDISTYKFLLEVTDFQDKERTFYKKLFWGIMSNKQKREEMLGQLFQKSNIIKSNDMHNMLLEIGFRSGNESMIPVIDNIFDGR